MKTIELLIIDPQQDFCLAPVVDHGVLKVAGGSLFVPGADADMSRLAKMVTRLSSKLDDIHVTLDSHHYVDVAHPIFWKNSQGEHPNPFTIISVSDVENGVWTTTKPGMYRRALDYVRVLAQNGKYPLCIWPYHCLIGTAGHCVVPELAAALQVWEQQFAMVHYVTKGSNIYTEHYSAIAADVPDPSDPSTQINTSLIQTLMQADEIPVAGEASSHCVKNTLVDIANNFGDDSYVKKFVILTDAMSPVPGFESFHDDFMKEMKSRGAQFSTTVDYLA